MRNLLPAVAMTMLLFTACSKSKNNDRNYEVNNSTSVAEWKGSAPDHFHVGSFEVKGSVKAAPNGDIKAGTFTIPIASIKNFDLPDHIKPQLLTHLQSADFFNMALHPNAAFVITKVDKYVGHDGVPGSNRMVTGNFTMVGQTHPISFPAKIIYTADSLKVEATLQVDRSKWGMVKYTDATAPDYILPNADIQLKVQAGLRN